MSEKTIIDKQGQVLVQDPPIAFALFQLAAVCDAGFDFPNHEHADQTAQ